MDDQELAAIRAARLNQLRQNAATEGGQNASPSSEDAEAVQTKRSAEEQMRRDLLATVLDSAARERRELTPAIRVLVVVVGFANTDHCARVWADVQWLEYLSLVRHDPVRSKASYCRWRKRVS